jgi:glutathione S-transferase
MLTIWGRKNSQNVQKVMWLVGELGLAHRRIDVGGRFGGLATAEFLAMNPHSRIPVIDDGGTIGWESQAILRYLAAKYAPRTPGGDSFWPEDPASRLAIDGWMDWSATALQPSFLGGIFQGYFRTPQQQRNWPAINRAIEQCGALFLLLDAQLQGRSYLLGDRLTLADIPVACNFYRYFELDLPRPKLPNVEAYYARLKERPAYREHVMVSFADLQGFAAAR